MPEDFNVLASKFKSAVVKADGKSILRDHGFIISSLSYLKR